MTEAPEIRLIVVDGDAMLRQRLVQEAGSRPEVSVVATAMGFRTGMPKIESYQPNAVVVDLVTEDVEGLALMERLRAQGSQVALVGLVADVATERSARAKELGARLVPRPGDFGDGPFAVWFDLVCSRCREGGATAAAAPAAPTERTRPMAAPAAAPAVAPTAAVVPAAPVAPPVAPRQRPPIDRPAPAAPAPARRVEAPVAAPIAPRAPRRGRHAIEVVGIGISTGGPKALAVMLPMLPADFAVPILIVQHMPPVFTASLAESLSRQCKLPVREARAGEPVLPGQVLIAPGGKHMRVVRSEAGVVVRITEDPPENSCRPAVDYLFRSLAEVYGAATCAVMMTGMGEDGFAACRQLHGIGARILAQDEASCTVFGMPRGPIASGIVDVVAPLEALAGKVVESVKGDWR